VDRIARALNVDRAAAAAGIVRVANANMERATRVVSVERGFDPRDFALVAFGGCGGLHACEIAEDLGIASVVVPQHAGALSALGMLLADAVRDYAAGVFGRTDIEEQFAKLERRARRESPGATILRSADLRYRGQSYELNIPWPAEKTFHVEHRRIFGYALPERPLEIVTIRVRARSEETKPRFTGTLKVPGSAVTRKIWIGGAWRKAKVWRREQLPASAQRGPALVLDYGATTVIPPGWRFHVDRAGNLVIQRYTGNS
jgi:N-methylhydantoinase A